jgi:hypothetical protein
VKIPGFKPSYAYRRSQFELCGWCEHTTWQIAEAQLPCAVAAFPVLVLQVLARQALLTSKPGARTAIPCL